MAPIAPNFGTCITVVAASAASNAARRVTDGAASAIGAEGGAL